MKLLILLMAGFLTSAALGQVQMGGKRLVILRPGVEAIWGSYVFAVENFSAEAQEASLVFELPVETVDWAPQEGAQPKDLSLGEDGGLTLKMTFPPGMHMISIGFKLDAVGTSTGMTLKPRHDITDLTFLYPRDASLRLEGERLKDQGLDRKGQDPYQAFSLDGTLNAGDSLALTVTGIPEGRSRPYLIGALIGAFMLISVSLLAIKTRPKGIEDSDELLLSKQEVV